MLLAKPHHSLWAHLEDAYRVFQFLWFQNQVLYEEWARKYGFNPEEVYYLLGLGVYLHDIGKSNSDWQIYLKRNEKRANISHPLLSFAVIWELFQRWEGDRFYHHPLLRSVLTSVLAHHHQLHHGSYDHVRRQLSTVCLPEKEVNEILNSFVKINNSSPMVLFTNKELTWTGSELAERVGLIRQNVNQLSKKEQKQAKALHSFFLSVICQCDHVSSAISEQLQKKETWDPKIPALKQAPTEILRQWIPGSEISSNTIIFKSPNALQQELMKNISPYMLIRAGCGEGKTGAAIWYARHWLDKKKANRIIYTLPTRFTINSMYQDFIDPNRYNFPREMVGMYHSDAFRILKAMKMDEREDPEYVWKELKSQVYQSSIFRKKLTICTVDHLLYSLLHAHKHSDIAFGNLQQSVIIFDELHYYEEYIMRKIGQCFRLLKEMKIPHLIMSATLSEALLEKINQTDKKNPYVLVEKTISDKEKMPFLIHKAKSPLISKDLGLSEEAGEFIKNHLMFRQLVVTNQVERAKAITKELMQTYPDLNILCYHSEFAPKDRAKKEKVIKILFKAAKDRNESERKTLQSMGYKNNDQVILVSTQICELSLDISADIQLTELAPIDALSQRGGRLHRMGASPDPTECRCARCEMKTDLVGFSYKQIIFPLDLEDPNAGYPYCDRNEWAKSENLLIKSWEIIGDKYSFSHVKEWVNRLYPNYCRLSDKEMHDYILEDAVFGKRPVDRYGTGYQGEESEGSFQVRQTHYRTVEVLPICYRHEVLERILDQKEFPIEVINDYLVPMKAYRFGQCQKGGFIEMIEPMDDCTLLFVNISYDPNGIGFDFDNQAVPSFDNIL